MCLGVQIAYTLAKSLRNKICTNWYLMGEFHQESNIPKEKIFTFIQSTEGFHERRNNKQLTGYLDNFTILLPHLLPDSDY